jgi:hypothetical protein
MEKKTTTTLQTTASQKEIIEKQNILMQIFMNVRGLFCDLIA